MNTLVCPISIEKVNSNMVRIIGMAVALSVLLYSFTSNVWIMAALLTDFTIRGFGNSRYSPLRWLASKIASKLELKPKMIDKAPKLFAARVGFVFSLSTIILSFVSPIAALSVAFVLLGCALLESLANFCVGCAVYTYIVLPLNKR